MKKEPFQRAPQVGDTIKYQGKFYEVFSITPDDDTFLIDIGKKPLELGGDDWDIYVKD